MFKLFINRYIKESFDNLPIGVSIFNENGIAVLSNYKMRDVVYRLCKREYRTIAEFDSLLNREYDNARIIDRVIYFDDGEAYEIGIKQLVDRYERKYTQVIVNNVTVLNDRQNDLREKNDSLSKANLKLQDISKNLLDIIREEETLTLKIKVHDETGKSIIQAKELYKKRVGLDELKKFAKTARQSFDYLNYVNKEVTISQLTDYASRLGITLNITDLPTDVLNISVLNDVISEVITNTHKHGHGSVVDVLCKQTEDKYIIYLSNNGIVPKEIKMSGGLSHLSRKIENMGGKLEIDISTKFMIILTYERNR